MDFPTPGIAVNDFIVLFFPVIQSDLMGGIDYSFFKLIN